MWPGFCVIDVTRGMDLVRILKYTHYPMLAPEAFTDWLSKHKHKDKKLGHTYLYHSRSDAHSIALCLAVLNDILERSPFLQEQALRGEVARGINLVHRWLSTNKKKTLDLAIGRPISPLQGTAPLEEAKAGSGLRIVKVEALADVLIACEAKSVMTEHKKSEPRVYDELSSAHEIVHQGRQEAIAAGITVVNIAQTFVSPLRQKRRLPLQITKHNQPKVAASMISHLRGLPIRESIGEVGFDAYCTIVIECDNLTGCRLWRAAPAPQPGDRDHYETFLDRLVRFYAERFSSL